MVLGKNIQVLFANRKEITLYEVAAVSNGDAVKKGGKSWKPEEPESIGKAVQELLEKSEIKRIRLLLGEDISYTTELETSLNSTRKEIFENFSHLVPENLDEYTWDFKRFEENKVVAFAPVKEIYDVLINALKESGIEVEAVEPEKVAKERDKDPVVGIALKKDIKGKDEDVLNLEIKKEQKQAPEKEEENKSEVKKVKNLGIPKKMDKRNLLLITVALLLFVGAGIIIYRYIKTSGITENVGTIPQSVREVDLDEAEEQENELEETEVDLDQISILILNGSGIPGEAGRVRGILEEEGFSITSIGDAPDHSSAKTEMRVKESTPSQVIDLIEDLLENSYDIEVSEIYLEETVENSVILILGQNIS